MAPTGSTSRSMRGYAKRRWNVLGGAMKVLFGALYFRPNLAQMANFEKKNEKDFYS